MAHLKNLRKSLGMKACTLAERAQLSPGYLSRLERGLTGMSADTARRIADALGVEPAQVMFPESANSPEGSGR